VPTRRDPRSAYRARVLRAESTGAENALWKLLRNRQIGDAKFRRQHPIGPYVVDFACIEAKMIVEVDGPSHDLDEQRSFDADRTAHLERDGWRVLRIRNAEVESDPSGVAAFILRALA
jgi:primosomal protein N' (replication factor Y)